MGRGAQDSFTSGVIRVVSQGCAAVFLILHWLRVELDLRRPMAVWDQSQPPASRDLIQGFLGSGTSSCAAMSKLLQN
jgi:hypothetical protein